MANVNSVQHAASVSPSGAGAGGDVKVAWGTIEIGTALADNDTITFFKLPAGATVLTGWLIGDDIDTGTEELEIDVGDSDDTSRFLNSGVLTGDAITGTKPEVGILVQLFGDLKDGPHTYTSDTDIIGTVVADDAAGGTGTLSLVILYTYNDVRVSPPEKPV
jgi:hypothetical protein